MLRRGGTCTDEAARLVLLGGTIMQAATEGGSAQSREERIERALILLAEAQTLLDVDREMPEVGARLQAVIDELLEIKGH